MAARINTPVASLTVDTRRASWWIRISCCGFRTNWMQRQLHSFDFILDTASGKHDLNAYLKLLKRDGALTLVGIPAEPEAISVMPLVRRRRSLVGSLIGGIAETQEMLDFCADRGITCEIEVIPMEQINEAYERMLKSDVKYRFVIDVARLR